MSVPAPRLRFSPSPTGLFHVGSARSALFNWLVARREGGTFILRIEDTDAERNREEWVRGIEEAMRWLGLDWDEYHRQSERWALYADAAAKLVAGAHAYYCDCTREEVEARTRRNPTPGYDRHCRDRGLGPGPDRALRFRVPREGSTTVVDVVRGAPVFEHSAIEDFVLVRSTGVPLFLLANVVDDIDMAVTHVVRGEEHLPNTPKYLLLWRALGGGPEPVFAHLPVLVNERRQKLSKRRDRVAVEDFRAQGYLAEAMRNYLVLLGWAPADGREFLSLEEIVDEFRLEEVNNSPAFFDERKLAHFNQHYILRMPPDAFVAAARPFLAQGPWDPADFDLAAFEALAPLVQERVRTLGEVPAMVDFLFLPEPALDERAWRKRVVNADSAPRILDAAIEAYAGCEWTAAALHGTTGQLADLVGLPLGKAQFPVRVAVTGRDVGPPLFESLAVLGRERTLERLRRARARLD